MRYRTDLKTLCSITFDLSDLRTRLDPAVPQTAAMEDQKTERVCLAPTVSQCIAALGPEHRDLRVGRDIIVRKISIAALDPDLLVYPRDLFATKRVPDALEHQEHWYLGPIGVTPERFTITDFRYEYAIAFSCISIAQIDAIIERFCPEERRGTGESVRNAYRRIVGKLQAAGRHDASDAFEDAVAELPFAQCLKIYDLRLEKPAPGHEKKEEEDNGQD